MSESAANLAWNGHEWMSYHIFYHSQRERLLFRLVVPVLQECWRRRWMKSFFYVRYMLGGPHVRVRILCPLATQEGVEGLLRARASDFFGHWPSVSSLSKEEIWERNRLILGTDPGE